ncbi:MAG: general secretion pathway protein GspB [Proteobacteria bacterium]|nr:general secretion pathway protein GspB [Pseudomonadota bacterium]
MSFILDALRKSETDRQQHGSAEFAAVPASSAGREGPPAWLWVVGALLLVNAAVLIGIFLRPDAEPAALVPAEPATATSASAIADDDFRDKVAAARENAPPRGAGSPATRIRPAPAGTSVDTAALPTIHEVRANGAVTIPDLHVDIHVFSESADDRFVFINMTRHNEGSRLAEGPLVEEITPDGVVLSMHGTTFLLPRDQGR